MTPEDLEDLKAAVNLGGVVYRPSAPNSPWLPVVRVDDRVGDRDVIWIGRGEDEVFVLGSMVELVHFAQLEPIFRP